MFKSKIRSIVISQYEHSRLAGNFAMLWGNEDFDKPTIDFASFVQGVALHDWHYGIVDNLPIGKANEADWLAMTRKGVDYWFEDPITDIVAKRHLRRLLNGQEGNEIEKQINQIDLRITERIVQTDFSYEQFEWADNITRFCDNLAFDFSFEKPTQESVLLYAKVTSNKETPVAYKISAKGEIIIDPWPFSVSSFSGIITGYKAESYPENLEPKSIPYHCQPEN